jgi:hypothetical protein
VVTVTQHGDGGVGTTYLNTSTFLGRETPLTYVVCDFVPGERIRLREAAKPRSIQATSNDREQAVTA